MLKKALVATATIGAFAMSGPALAGSHHHGGSGGGCHRYGCTSTSTSSSGGHTSSSTSSSSGGYTSTSTSSSGGGTKVPEPGTLGLMGAGLAGLGMLQVRRRKQGRK